jgi:hypothetical protein
MRFSSILRRAAFVIAATHIVACSGAGDDPNGVDAADDVETTFGETSASDSQPLFEPDQPSEVGPPTSDAKSSADGAPPALPSKAVLSFTWKGQETGYWCGPGSTRMALSTRLSGSALPSQSTLAGYLGTTTAGTDHIGLVANALNHFLSTTRYKRADIHDPPTTAQRAKLKDDIVALVGTGWPLVANVVSGWRPPGYPAGTIYHYVAIVGFDDGGDKVLIADPAGAGAGGSGWKAVPQTYWVALGDLAVWIGGKGYTGR